MLISTSLRKKLEREFTGLNFFLLVGVPFSSYPVEKSQEL